jgi:protein dithiol:quinone oxidoreductase
MAQSTGTARRWLVAMAVVCFAAVAAALVSQYVFEMQPCPWCILQRLIFVVVGVLCVVAAAIAAPAARKGVTAGALVLAGLGAAAAVWQHAVAAKSASCNLTLADKVITALRVDSIAPWLFEVKATCADAAVSMLGLPYEYWSLGLFVLLALAALAVIARRR